MAQFASTNDPLPFWCMNGDHRTTAEISVITSERDFYTHEHEWVWAPRTKRELIAAGYTSDGSLR